MAPSAADTDDRSARVRNRGAGRPTVGAAARTAGPVVAAGSSTSRAPAPRPDVDRSADRRGAARTNVDPMDAGRTGEDRPVGTRAGPPRTGARPPVVPPSGAGGRVDRARRGTGRAPTAVRPSVGRNDRSMLRAGRGGVHPVRPVRGPRPGSSGRTPWVEDRPVGTPGAADRQRTDRARPVGGSVRNRADAGRSDTPRIAGLRSGTGRSGGGRSGTDRGHPAHPGSDGCLRRSAARTAVDRRVDRRDAGIRRHAIRRIGRRARRPPRVRSGVRWDGPSAVRRSGPASGAWD